LRRLLVVLQEQLVLALELQVAELQRPGQEQRLKLLGFEAELALELGLLPLVAWRELESLEFEPALELEPPLFLRLLVVLQKQLELVELLRQG